MYSELAKIFASPLRAKFLTYFALQDEERRTARAAAPTIGVSVQKARAELAALARLGLLTARSSREGIQYGWNRAHPHALALSAFLRATVIPDDRVIADLFRRLGVHLVIAAGLLAGETRGAVDLLIVTRKPKDARIAPAVKKLEMLAAIPIRFAVLGIEEYHERREAHDRMLRDILDFKHRPVLGWRGGR